MAEADECENIARCQAEAPQEPEVDDPSILPETGAGPVEVGPLMVTGPLIPCDISYLQSNFKPLLNFSIKDHADAVANVVANSALTAGAAGAAGGVFAIARAVAAAAAAAGNDVATAAAAASHAVTNHLLEIARHAAVAEGDVPTEIQQRDQYGFVKSDEDSSTNVSETITTGTGGGDPLSYSFQIMAYIESQIKTYVLGLFNELFIELYASLSAVVTNISGANPIKGFVGITMCGFLSKYTTVIYYAGRIPYNYRVEIVRLIEEYNQEIKQRIERWAFGGVEFTCKVEKSPVQYDTQKIILCIKLATDNVIQIPILNVVGFPVFQDVTPLLRLVTPPSLPCFFTPRDYHFYLDIIRKFRVEFARFIEKDTLAQGIPPAFASAYPTKFNEFVQSRPDTQGNPFPFMLTFPDQLAKFIASHTDEPRLFSALITSLSADILSRKNINLQTLSLLDIIVRAILCAKQGPITALSEPSKEEVTLIISCFQGLIPTLPTLIPTITEAIRTALYTDANIKAFSLFCNIFYNFINVSSEKRSLAKIIYSEFFGTSDNYGKVIRTCQVVNSLPIMREHVKFFLTGSNAARVYLALNDIIKLGGTLNPETIKRILNGTFGNLSDNDFMIYLKNADSEPSRVFIRMILGESFYFFKNLFDDTTTRKFTLEMIQSVGIVGFMDHLFAQRFDAKWEFLRRCYGKDPTSFLAHILPSMGAYFGNLDKQINVAHLDGVFKYYTLVTFYTKMCFICKINLSVQDPTISTALLNFLINKATSIDCIATVWTLVLNVLYTLFVPENCLARIAVGKFDNDPKNLKLYMGILNDHLTELHNLGYTHEAIPILVGIQTNIIDMCEQGIHNGPAIFKQACDTWVQKMVDMAVSGPAGSGPAGQGLFMLSVSDTLEIRGEGRSTNLERALCLAYLPTAQGNICSAASSSLPQSSPFFGQISSVLQRHTLYDPSSEVTTRSQIIDPKERELRLRLNQMGVLMDWFKTACQVESDFSPEIKDPLEKVRMSLSKYINESWKHLTKRAVDLKIILKENLSDMKRVTGIKYIALVLGGYFQIRLLIDEIIRAECPTPCAIREKLDLFKVNEESLNCKRGLLPLLIHPNLITLIINIIEIDIGNELSHAAAHATAIATLGITPEQYAAAAALGITPEQYAAVAAGTHPDALGITGEQYAACVALGMAPDQYIRSTNYTADIATALRITPLQYNAVAAVGITPAQYATVYATPALGITPLQYNAVVAAAALGITPEHYAAAVTAGVPAVAAVAAVAAAAALGITPEHYAAAVAAGVPAEHYAANYVAAAAALGVTPEQYAAVAAAAALSITSEMYDRFTTFAYSTVYAIAYNSSYKAYHSRIAEIKANRNSAMGICFGDAATAVSGFNTQAAGPAYGAIYSAARDAYIAAIANIIPRILKILGFLFSIKVKSTSPHSPYQLLRLEDSMIIFPSTKDDPKQFQILNPTSGMFIEFLRELDIIPINKETMKCICREGGKNEVLRIDTEMSDEAKRNPLLQHLYTAIGGSNDSESNSGRNSVSSLNKYKHKYKHNKSSKTNNHTRRNKNNRKKNSKTKTKTKAKSSTKYKKVIPSSRSGSQSNRKKSKPKKSQKNVTFKRRRARK